MTAGDLVALPVTSTGDIYVSRPSGVAKSTDRGNSWMLLLATQSRPEDG